MGAIAGYFIRRGTEASSYAGFGSLVAGIEKTIQHDYVTGIPMVIAGLVAIFVKEKK